MRRPEGLLDAVTDVQCNALNIKSARQFPTEENVILEASDELEHILSWLPPALGEATEGRTLGIPQANRELERRLGLPPVNYLCLESERGKG